MIWNLDILISLFLQKSGPNKIHKKNEDEEESIDNDFFEKNKYLILNHILF